MKWAQKIRPNWSVDTITLSATELAFILAIPLEVPYSLYFNNMDGNREGLDQFKKVDEGMKFCTYILRRLETKQMRNI